ncbi:MAG: hypothetical protein ACI9GM_001191 [Salibacteraceae bacterium]|jgi:hypothetical protein
MSTHLINKTENGILFFCNGCKLLHLEFKNISLNFTKQQLNDFYEHVEKLDGSSWELANQSSPFRRKIVIPLFNGNFNFMINLEELIELKNLIHKTNNSLHNTLLKNIDIISRCN